ncbi:MULTISPECIES: sulfatase family protein [Rhodopirellula]|nr:sulfatase [Rhodopirellula sallentina]
MTCLLLICCEPVRSEAIHRPNVIIILTDDQGYQDLGCFGSPKIKTPCIDRMAEEGIRLTDFYVGASVCSASRASLLTGRMPARHGVGTAFFPGDGSMPTNEATIAELLKEAGYRTACFGKWHLGDENESVLPTGQGFDEYFGIPYSNDMYINPNHAFAVDTLFAFDYDKTKALADQDSVRELKRTKKKFDDYLKQGVAKKVPLFEGVKIVEYPADQATLTLRYFDRAIDFVEKSQDQPFFIYLTPAMPHVPLFASEDFAGKSERGLYGDVIEEIDFHTGRLLDHLRHSNRRNRTIVIFTSDNGPWLRKGNRSGCAIPLRDGKFTTYEGGVRMPCVMWWPGNWRPGSVSDQVISAMDLMPTIAHYAGARMPKVPLDGFNIANHLETPQTPVKRKYLYYTKGRKLSGVRRGDWKYLRHGGSMHQSSKNGPELYNLRDDVGERNNVAKSNPELIEQLEQELRRFEMTMTD